MRFVKDTPKVNSLNELDNFRQFLQLGQHEFCYFLKNFLNLEQVRIQTSGLDELKKWLKVESLDEAMAVPEDDREICVVSQIQANGELIAYFPYVLRGRSVKNILKLRVFYLNYQKQFRIKLAYVIFKSLKVGTGYLERTWQKLLFPTAYLQKNTMASNLHI